MGATALLVIDMQNGFCRPDGALPRLGMDLADVDRAIGQCVRAVNEARALGLPVIFTRQAFYPGGADEGPNHMSLFGIPVAQCGLTQGSWDCEVISELDWSPAELTVDKPRFDAFLWTSLDPLLRGLGVDHLLVCGVVTNICVESTVRSAFMRDYRVTLLGDCCAAQTPRMHEIGLEVMSALRLATVVSLADGYRIGDPAGGRELIENLSR